jgi:large subunit ribosomal protein L14e
MALYEIGRLCVKIAGRDAGKKCVIVEQKDAQRVLIDGETRRRLCNVRHLEPLLEQLELSKGASHADVVAAFGKLGVTLVEPKPRKAAARPTKVRHVKEPAEKPAPKKAKVSKVKES